MALIYLARHGEHDEVGHRLSGRSEIGLNARGRAQAQSLVDLLDGCPIAAMYTSPRQRARETAAPLAGALGTPVAVTPALDEIDFGSFTGRSFAALDTDPDWQRWNAQRDHARCPGGETMAEAAERALAFLFSLGEGAVLCTTHCDVIRGVVTRLLGLPFSRMFMLDCEPGSITTLSIEDGAVRLVGLNRRVRL